MKNKDRELFEKWLDENEIIDKDSRSTKSQKKNKEEYYPFQDHKWNGKFHSSKKTVKFFVENENLFDEWLAKHDVPDKDQEIGDDAIYKYPPEYISAIKIQDTIDLHRMTVEKCIKALREFILKSYKNNITVVRIIHGKGLHSQGSPRLKPAVLRWLRTEGKSFVRFIKPASKKHGGDGATIVWLK